MAPHDPSLRGSGVRRRRVLILGALLLVLLAGLIVLQAVNLKLPSSPDLALVLYALSTLSFLAVVVLTVVLARQVLKLIAERRARVVGSRFKTRLVLGALALSLSPVLCMFGFTYLLINRTLDKWFSQPEVALEDNRELQAIMSNYIAANAMHEAQSLANSPETALAARNGDWNLVGQRLRLHEVTLEGGYVRILDRAGNELYRFDPSAAASGSSQVFLIGTAALAPAGGDARTLTIEVAMPRPPQLNAALTKLAQDAVNYDRLAQKRRQIRIIYTLLLLLLALAILFAATWIALVLAKGMAGPVAALVEATQEIRRGNLAFRVEQAAPDEFRTLIRSFNGMAEELESNRAQIEASRQELQAANHELESRRRYTETLLDNTPSAVLSLDRAGRISRANAAVRRLFGVAQPQRLEELFDPAALRELRHLLRKAGRWPAATGQLEATVPGRVLTLAVTAAALPSSTPANAGEPEAAYVLVMEDLTDLLRIQKTAAWREVAQRIAHEIKNPLTPIALSAQRIRRRLEGRVTAEAAETTRVISECAETIEQEAHSLQRLVDEFSAFARFPSAQPAACDLNEVIERALRAFDGRLEGIEVRTEFEPLPPLQADPEEMKRVFINLIDNAVEAMRHSPYRQISLTTHRENGTIEAMVADTGPGIAPGDKQRLFLPYFSTKARGTGLGLAIVARIVEESGGTLRVEDNIPVGARFILELNL